MIKITTEYCEEADVQRILQKATVFSGSTTPTAVQVEDFINAAEDEIDQRTQHAWRLVTVTDEFYDLPSYGHAGHHSFDPGIKIHLRHRKITTLANGTDKLEVWTGSEYEDWTGTRTEGRANDFWIDLEQGVLWIKYFYPFFTERAVRMTYRYGETSVPKDIRDATAMLAAIKVLQSDDRSAELNETGDPSRLPYDGRIAQWNAQVNRILKNRTELNIVN